MRCLSSASSQPSLSLASPDGDRQAPYGSCTASVNLFRTRATGRDTARTSTLTLIRGDKLSDDELKLANLVNRYRANHDLPKIPLSKALTIVGNRHVRNLYRHDGFNGSLHSWSDAPYDANDPNTYPSMWEAPQRLKTGYPGNGYENAYGASGFPVTPKGAFEAWKNSPPHNAVMLSEGVWANFPWNSLGIGIHKGFAVLWFGSESDPTGKPARES